MRVSHGYGMHPCASWTGTPVSLPAQQPPGLVTLHMTGVSKGGIYPRGHWLPTTVYNRNCSDPESGLLDTLDLGAGGQAGVPVQMPAGRQEPGSMVPGLWASFGVTRLV